MIKIYHNPRCKKSRAGLKYLEDKGVEFEVVEYLKEPLTEEELEKIITKLNMKPGEIVRTQEDYYKKQLKGREFNDHEWIKILTENPKLIRRPIVVKNNKAVIGDPAENIKELGI